MRRYRARTCAPASRFDLEADVIRRHGRNKSGHDAEKAASAVTGDFKLNSSDLSPEHDGVAPRRQRSVGQLAVTFAAVGGRTRIEALSESGPLRLRVPRAQKDPLEAVLLNTGGGIACGDRLEFSVHAEAGSDAVVTSQAAERIYRSDGPLSEIGVRLSLHAGASLAWLPQETILFDRAKLRRRFEVDIAVGARLLTYESVVFGRAASGETMTDGLLHDIWRVRRGGNLIFADSPQFDGPIAQHLMRPAIGGGARALATLLYVAEDAETRLDEARVLLAASPISGGASAWRGFLAVRFLAPEIGQLRTAATGFMGAFTRRPMPRVWML